eukprot:gene6787-10951_t
MESPKPLPSGTNNNNFGGTDAHAKAELWFNIFPGTVLLAIILFFVMAVLFSRKQPLKSRGVTPFFLAFVLFIKIVVDVILHITIDGCSSIWLVGVSNTCYFAVLFHLLRYLLVVFFNSRKAIFKSKKNKIVKVQMFFLKFITSFIPYMIIMMFMIAVFGIYHLSFYFGTGQTCNRDGFLLYSRIYSYVLVTIQMLLLGVLVVFDLILNWRLFLRCKISDYFIKEDPYYFRFEMILYLAVFVINYLFILTGVILDSIAPILGQNSSAKEAFDTFFEVQRLIPDGMLIIVVFGFPLLLTIVKSIISKIKKTDSKKVDIEQLDFLLHDEHGYKMFFDFAQNEWSLENIKFWTAIEEWNKEKSRESALEIYGAYLNGALSPLEINVPKKQCTSVWKVISDEQQEIKSNLFDELMCSIKTNLADTYSRLVISPEYTLFVKKHKFQDKLIKDFK